MNTGPGVLHDYRRATDGIGVLEARGASPKRFLQYLTVEHAKRALRDGPSVLATAYEAGLSGPGRLHDLFVAVEAVTPGEYKALGEGLAVRYGFSASPFGRCLVAVT